MKQVRGPQEAWLRSPTTFLLERRQKETQRFSWMAYLVRYGCCSWSLLWAVSGTGWVCQWCGGVSVRFYGGAQGLQWELA